MVAFTAAHQTPLLCVRSSQGHGFRGFQLFFKVANLRSHLHADTHTHYLFKQRCRTLSPSYVLHPFGPSCILNPKSYYAFPPPASLIRRASSSFVPHTPNLFLTRQSIPLGGDVHVQAISELLGVSFSVMEGVSMQIMGYCAYLQSNVHKNSDLDVTYRSSTEYFSALLRNVFGDLSTPSNDRPCQGRNPTRLSFQKCFTQSSSDT
ncbi:hypothetical protein GALMADRAFT_406867 [Galerina marginata CBS 339.88]|uniref:Uncharacterized protein n=1 Tax=Galerina marginata (strain CBS 339.88) TaxID=685588 RepID=A0A067TEY4_GALM3|nr:hypothetical protein GALMADRAFT_406867 [Galerina marginata CBS 339.88]